MPLFVDNIKEAGVKEDHRENYSLAFLGLSLMALVALHSFFRAFDSDEIETLHTAWKILHGERIYIDFFQNHHPFFYYLLTLPIVIFGENTGTIIVVRGVLLFLNLAIFAVVWRLGKLLFNKPTAWLAVIFLETSILFVNKAIEIRPDVPQTLSVLLCVYWLLRYSQRKPHRQMIYLFLSAASLAASFLFLQKSVFFMALIGAWFLYELIKGRIPPKHAAIYASVTAIILFPYYLYLAASGSFHDYFLMNWWLNSHLIRQFSPFFTIWQNQYCDNAGFWIFAVIGAFSLRGREQKTILYIFTGLFASVFFVKIPWPQYFMPSMPFLAIIAAHGFYKISRLKNFLTPFLLALALFFPVRVLVTQIFIGNQEQLRRINYGLGVTKPGDFVWDGNNSFNVFRRDISYYWFAPEVIPMTPNSFSRLPKLEDLEVKIRQFKPTLISDRYVFLGNNLIRGDYVRSEFYTDLYLRKPDRS